MFGATAAASGGARALFQLGQRVDASAVNRVNDRALGYADAAADNFSVGHGGDTEAGIFGWGGKEELPAMRCEVFARVKPVHVAMAVGRIANEDGAAQLAVAESKFFVDAQRGVFVANDVGAGGFVGKVPCGENVNGHNL